MGRSRIWRPVDRWLAVWSVLSVLLMVAIGLFFVGDSAPSGLDARIGDAIDRVLSGQGELMRLMVSPTQPYVLIPVIVFVTAACLLDRRRSDALLIALGPMLAAAVNTWVLKPVFDRHYHDYLAYPSGHTVSLVATLVALVLLARPGVATAVTAVVGAVALVAAAIGMVGLGFHYASDVVGGVLFAVAFMLGTRLVIELVIERGRPRRPVPAPSAD